MKKLILVISLVVASSSYAQDYKASDNGETVVLCKSKTWANDMTGFISSDNASRQRYYFHSGRCYKKLTDAAGIRKETAKLETMTKKQKIFMEKIKREREADARLLRARAERQRAENLAKDRVARDENRRLHADSNRNQKRKAVHKGTYTVKGNFACFSKIWLDDLIAFRASDDFDSVKAYIATRKCIVIDNEVKVTLIDSPGLFGGTASFIFKGTKFWTVRGGLDYGY